MSGPYGTRRFRMSQPIIDAWARVSGDHNPLHVDEAYACGTSFGGTIAHGHYSLALIEDLLLASYGGRWLSGGLLREVKFRAPVRPGGEYEIRLVPRAGELADGASAAQAGEVVVEVRDLADETLAVRGVAVLAAPEPTTGRS